MSQPTLEQIREKIDDVDDRIHALLMERAMLGELVVAAKNGAAPDAPRLRPGREASILRRLRQRHSGSLPFPVVAHMWREMMTAFLNRQSPIEIAVWGGRNRIAVWDIARAHFGVNTRFTPQQDASAALAHLAATPGAIGVFAFDPAAAADGGEPWWRSLASSETNGAGLQIFARLPFFVDNGTTAFAVANAREDSGDETTLAVLQGVGGNETRSPAGDVLARHSDTALVAIPGFHRAGDPALEAVRAAHGARSAAIIGGYANPIKG
ncbi:chorismate mutase [Emcibacter sp. SYSU 3D8]|uniref:chorismate mutase n=1 Tax=Emcibacter sp. SYSU 3D8 TaxID=3133969 RepID=UPI0031FF09D2